MAECLHYLAVQRAHGVVRGHIGLEGRSLHARRERLQSVDERSGGGVVLVVVYGD